MPRFLMVSRMVSWVVLITLFALSCWLTEPPKATPDKPVFEVSIETLVKGRAELDQKELRSLVLSSLENEGIRKELVFINRDLEEAGRRHTQRGRTGDFLPLQGTERGNLTRPSHLIKVTATVERTLSDKIEEFMLPADFVGALLGDAKDRNMKRKGRRTVESVNVQIRVNVFDIVSGLSVGAVPRMESKAESSLLESEGVVIDHREWLRLWIFEIPVRVVDAEYQKKDRKTTSVISLTNRSIDFNMVQLVEKLQKLNLKPDPRIQESDLSISSINADRKSFHLSGKTDQLTPGDLVSITVMPVNRESGLGEPSATIARVSQVSNSLATATFFDQATREDVVLPDQYYVDPRYPVIVLKRKAFSPDEIVIESISVSRDSVVLSGNLVGIKPDDLLVASVRQVRDPSQTSTIYLKVRTVGKEIAAAVVWDLIQQKNTTLDDRYVINKSVPVRKL